MPDDDRWLVIGLGNPGPSYTGHRHNVGAMVVDLLAQRAGGRFKSFRGRADVLEGRLGGPGGPRAVLAKPRAYMNESGGPVAALTQFFRLGPDRLVVVHDELDLPFGSLRVKCGGGDNGHNGLKSVRRSLGTGEWFRVRVGIGRPPGRMDPADYVLQDFSGAERKVLGVEIENAADAVESLIRDGLDTTQTRHNS
jgi:PTH1 family peptidyl-tRNA hydrolase